MFKKNSFIAFFIFTIALILRIYKLDYCDLWSDEVFTALGWDKGWGAPFYQTFIYYWHSFFPKSEFFLRLPSAIFGALSIVMMFFVGKELIDKKAGILSALLMGLSTYHLWYAQEARHYSLSLFLSMVATYYFIKGLNNNKWLFWIIYIIYATLTIYTNYFHIFLLIVQLLYLFINRKVSLEVGIILIAIPLAYLPHLESFALKIHYIRNSLGWIPPANMISFLMTFKTFLFGYSENFYVVRLIIIAISLKSLFLFKHKNLRPKLSLCLLFFLIPIIIIYVYSQIAFPIYTQRYLITFSPYFYLFLCIGLLSFKKPYNIIVLGALLYILVSANINYYNGKFYRAPVDAIVLKKPIKPFSNYIQDNYQEGDVLAFTHRVAMMPFRWYKPKIPFYFLYDSDIRLPVNEEVINNLACKDLDTISFKRLWVVASDWAREGPLDINSTYVKKFLDNKFTLKASQEIDGVWIYLYQLH